jgi:hypothetical protein
MRTRPTDVTDEAILGALRSGWAIEAESVAYLPVGFGSHHWTASAGDENGVPGWFITVDDLDARRFDAQEPRDRTFVRLRSGLRVARTLADAGLAFVVPPIPDRNGDVLRHLDERYSIAVYPQVGGRAGRWGEHLPDRDRRALVELIAAVHGATAAIVGRGVDVERETFAIQARDVLDGALADLGTAWTTGPYADPARNVLKNHSDEIRDALAIHDAVATDQTAAPNRFVLTHGEPHPGNLLRTDEGMRLIDWDTAMLAPLERDLWLLATQDAEIATQYERTTGRRVEPALLGLYRLRWLLADVATLTATLRAPHEETEDTAKALAELARSVAALIRTT